jgi:phage shock protein PspC (stress-responsive transcriptional regulator)
VLLAIFGGAGIPVYLVAWLLIRQQGADRLAAERLFNR